MDQRQKRRRIKRRQIMVFLLSTLVLTVLLLGVFLAGFCLNLQFASLIKLFDKNYVYRIGSEELRTTDRKKFSYSPDFICEDGQLYVNFSYLADVCAFSVSGDYDQLRYLLRNEGGDDLIVNIGTTSVVVGGQSVSLSVPSFQSDDGSLYLPCSFVDTYFDGISIEQDEENDHLILVSLNAEGQYALTLHQLTECEPIDPNSIPDQP
ncbi:MAG: stalk domain-containing protein [Eubacteriales bacterium]